MIYAIDLRDNEGNLYPLDEPLCEGGTQELGGNTETWLNVTYNYAWYFHRYLDRDQGIRWLYGKQAKDCVDRLKKAIEPFSSHKPYDRDYWADTPGNCVQPLRILLGWCKKFPEGVFVVY